MARKIKKRPTKRRQASSSEALNILASLIAQFHMKKLNGIDKVAGSTSDSSDGVNNE